MIKFFRKIRYNLMSENKTGKYFKYAVGEIVLVVIGILIALQINNWNQDQNDKRAGIEIYKNLQRTLKQDSIAVQNIINLQNKSLVAQKTVFQNDINDLGISMTKQSLDSLLKDIMFGAFSFYPKNGIYNLIVSNNEMDLLESTEIKNALTNLYEYQYKRYENLDPTIEEKFQFQLNPLVTKKIGFVVEFSNEVNIIASADPEMFVKHYEDLTFECKDMYTALSAGNKLLQDIKISINELQNLIRFELENNK